MAAICVFSNSPVRTSPLVSHSLDGLARIDLRTVQTTQQLCPGLHCLCLGRAASFSLALRRILRLVYCLTIKRRKNREILSPRRRLPLSS